MIDKWCSFLNLFFSCSCSRIITVRQSWQRFCKQSSASCVTLIRAPPTIEQFGRLCLSLFASCHTIRLARYIKMSKCALLDRCQPWRFKQSGRCRCLHLPWFNKREKQIVHNLTLISQVVCLDYLALVSQVIGIDSKNKHEIFSSNHEIAILLYEGDLIHTLKSINIKSSPFLMKKSITKSRGVVYKHINRLK